MWQDLRFGLRVWARQPGLTLVVLLTLALGIGGNTAIFSVVNAVLLRPLTFHEPDRLVRVWGVDEAQARKEGDAGRHDYGVSINDLVAWKEQSRAFEGLALYGSSGGVTLTGVDEAVQVRVSAVSPEWFQVLGVQPLIGRFFGPDSGIKPDEKVVVISEELWRRRFAADPSLLGRSITLAGWPHTVIGVLPAGVEPPILEKRGAPDLWKPFSLEAPDYMRGGHWFEVIGRLKPGVPVARAQAELDAINSRLAKERPDTNTGWSAVVKPLSDSLTQEVRPALLLLLGAVGFVLLIATANVANLLVARSATRQREMAIRSALGAGRARLLRQLLVESLLVAVAGGALGLLLSLWTTDLLVSLSLDDMPRMQRVEVDGRVLAFTLAVSLTTGVLFGLLPALQGSRLELRATSGVAGREATGGRSRWWTRQVLVAGEVALSLILLVGAGLLVQSLWRLQRVDPGFRPEQVLLAEVATPKPATTTPQQVLERSRRLMEELRAIPGVTAAGSINLLPLGGVGACQAVLVEGRPQMRAESSPCVEKRSSSPGYFQAMGIPLMAGRVFDGRDTQERPAVAVINAALARRVFPGEDPVGKRIAYSTQGQPAWMEIVGVVGDVRHFGLEEEPRPELYQAQFQDPAWQYTLAVRAERDTNSLHADVRAVVRRIDPEMPVYKVRTVETLLTQSVAQPRFRALLLGLFAALAAALAAVGIAGVVSWSVSQRTREIGIRMALGAQARDVLRLVMGEGMAAVVVGVGLGVAGALALTRVLEGLLFGMSATDPMSFALGVLGLSVTALLASYLPARRALRVDPAVALRAE